MYVGGLLGPPDQKRHRINPKTLDCRPPNSTVLPKHVNSPQLHAGFVRSPALSRCRIWQETRATAAAQLHQPLCVQLQPPYAEMVKLLHASPNHSAACAAQASLVMQEAAAARGSTSVLASFWAHKKLQSAPTMVWPSHSPLKWPKLN